MPEELNAKDVEFVTKFKAYLQWVVAGSPSSSEEPRAVMLESFRNFMAANAIEPKKTVHFELLAKMTDFAKGSGSGDPR